jgi:hypothetical protein
MGVAGTRAKARADERGAGARHLAPDVKERLAGLTPLARDATPSPLTRIASDMREPSPAAGGGSRLATLDAMTEPRTCAACLPYSVRNCPEPVIGRSNKRFCSRTCQNRDQKERWREENWLAQAGIRLRERHAKAVKRNREALRQLEVEREIALRRLREGDYADNLEKLMLEAEAGIWFGGMAA